MIPFSLLAYVEKERERRDLNLISFGMILGALGMCVGVFIGVSL